MTTVVFRCCCWDSNGLKISGLPKPRMLLWMVVSFHAATVDFRPLIFFISSASIDLYTHRDCCRHTHWKFGWRPHFSFAFLCFFFLRLLTKCACLKLGNDIVQNLIFRIEPAIWGTYTPFSDKPIYIYHMKMILYPHHLPIMNPSYPHHRGTHS